MWMESSCIFCRLVSLFAPFELRSSRNHCKYLPWQNDSPAKFSFSLFYIPRDDDEEEEDVEKSADKRRFFFVPL